MKRFLLGLVLLTGVAVPTAHAQSPGQLYGAVSAQTGYAWPVVQRGEKNENVRALQMLLRARGSKLRADGRFGDATLRAVKGFQSQKRIKVDGVVGTQTWEKLVPVLGRGARGESVRALQMLLTQNGVSTQKDGVFGAATQRAVRAFQKRQNSSDAGATGSAAVWVWALLLGAQAAAGC